mgnify:CR=1 FL=1
MEEVKVIFRNSIEMDAILNASTLMTDSAPDIPGDLSEVRIKGEETDIVYHNARFMRCADIDGKYCFGFMEIPAEELQRMEMEQTITDLEIDQMEQEQEITDHDIAIMELQEKVGA